MCYGWQVRLHPIAPGEYYHLYNRGAFKERIFRDARDYVRFLFSVIYAQSPIPLPRPDRATRRFEIREGFAIGPEATSDIILNREVELTAFCLMPNHYHLLVKEVVEGGIARYMQRIGIGYTKYFNAKYGTSGHVFEGAYRAKQIPENNYLLYLSAYIHRNPRELKAWKGKEFEYPWSSLQDLTEANRWGGLLMSDIIAGQFIASPANSYKDFIETSTAKMVAEELPGVFA
jgi:putative transposase